MQRVLRAVKEMVESPYETRSDSFYFADDVLIMHNKAEYAYNRLPDSDISVGSNADGK